MEWLGFVWTDNSSPDVCGVATFELPQDNFLATSQLRTRSLCGDASTRSLRGHIGQYQGELYKIEYFEFSFTIRKAEGFSFGIRVGKDKNDNMLVLEVIPNGAVEAWNRQCADPNLIVRAGDKITKINSCNYFVAMMLEFRHHSTVKLTVVRGDPPCRPLCARVACRSAGHPTARMESVHEEEEFATSVFLYQ